MFNLSSSTCKILARTLSRPYSTNLSKKCLHMVALACQRNLTLVHPSGVLQLLSRSYTTKNYPEEALLKETFKGIDNHTNLLNCFSSKIEAKLNCPRIYSTKFRNDNGNYVCDLQLNWPEVHKISVAARKKKLARLNACKQALLWLYSKKVIDGDFKRPLLQDYSVKKNLVFVHLSDSKMSQIDDVIKMHSQQIFTALPNICNNESFSVVEGETLELAHPITGGNFPSAHELERCNRILKALNAERASTNALPIDEFRQIIVERVRTSRVTIIKGETGCGKTTKVPQFILDEAIAAGVGGYCNIAVTQPRRINAIQIAKFIAKERNEKVGKSIGYSVKMNNELPTVAGGSIAFFTAMKFAQKFVGNPSLQGISHVIVDEVHMRDIGTDLVMTLLKRAMKLNESLRVILMSATANTEELKSYFNSFGEVPTLEVAGRMYPVKMHFMQDLPFKSSPREKSSFDLEVDYELVHKMVLWIHKSKPPGGILIFVAGWSDMVELRKRFLENKDLVIIPVHSKFRDHSAAFEPLPNGLRKVILATNIAETSVTFPDIVYVIDCGLHKTSSRHYLSPGGWSSSSLSTDWITKANVLQRRGRAGRVQPGESFHLFSEENFNQMKMFEKPSILSESLEYVVLSVKVTNPDCKATDLLKEFPTPPAEEDVKNAVNTLQRASLLSHDKEQPTMLACLALNISTSLPSALALLHSAFYGCFNLMLSVVACEEAGFSFGTQCGKRNRFEMEVSIRSLKQMYHASSDHLAKVYAWNDLSLSDSSDPDVVLTQKLYKFLQKRFITSCKFLSEEKLNDHSSELLVQSLLLHSFGSLLVCGHGKSLNTFVKDRSGVQAIIGPSINANHKKWKSPFSLYMGSQMSRGMLKVNDTSSLSPLSVLLFFPDQFQTKVDGLYTTIKAWKQNDVCIAVPTEQYLQIQELRKVLRDVLNYFILAEAIHQPDDNYELMCEFRRNVMQCVNDILQHDWDQNFEDRSH